MTSPFTTHESVRFTFPTYLGAVTALLTVMEDARKTDRAYSFTGLTPAKILRDGLVLRGDVVDISEQLALIPGSFRSEE